MVDEQDSRGGNDASGLRAPVRRLFDHVRDPVLGVDGNGIIQFVNDAAVLIWGVFAEKGVGEPLSAFFDRETGDALQSLCVQGFEGVGESSVCLPDGRDLSFSVSRQDDSGSFVVLRDLSRRGQLEEELRYARRMASVGRLAAEIVHEINNPLAVIQGRLEMLRAMPEMSPETRERHLGIVDEHSKRVARIVQNLQIFARPRVPEPEPLLLSESISSSVTALGRRLERVRISVDIPPETKLYADMAMCSLVWENLLTSASNIMPAGAALSVSATHERNDSLRVLIACELGEWPVELLDELRSPYSGGSFRVDPGRGLALAISWGIIQEHGGTMTAQNNGAGGASIEVMLPGERDRALGSSEKVRTVTGWDILVVDDDVVMAETVGWMISTLGHRATIVHSAEDGLERLEHEAFHVIFTDQRLPGMDGETMLDKIHKEWPELSSRTVLTSGLLHRPKEGQAFIQKPFSTNQLATLFEDLK